MFCRRALLIGLAIAMHTTAVRGQAVTADSVLIAGAGYSGTWEVVLEFANPEPGPVNLFILYPAPVLLTPCPEYCPGTRPVTILANGSTSINLRDLINLFGGPQLVHVTRNGGPIPPMTARWANRANPTQKFEIPAIRVSSLQALNANALAFAGAREGPAGDRSNLVLSQLGGTTADILLEAFSPEGQRLGSRVISIPGDGGIAPGQPVFVARVLGSMGITAAQGVQLRTTRLSGDGVLWGYLATVDEAGAVHVSIGQNL